MKCPRCGFRSFQYKLISKTTLMCDCGYEFNLDKYKGIKEFSWLKLFIGYLKVIVPLGTLLFWGGYYHDLQEFRDIYGADIYTIFPLKIPIDIIVFILDIGLIYFSVYAGMMLNEIKPNAVRIAKTYLVTYLIYTIITAPLLLFTTYYSMNLSDKYDIAFAQSVGQILRATIIFSIWFTYLTRSKRVKATYFE